MGQKTALNWSVLDSGELPLLAKDSINTKHIYNILHSGHRLPSVRGAKSFPISSCLDITVLKRNVRNQPQSTYLNNQKAFSDFLTSATNTFLTLEEVTPTQGRRHGILNGGCLPCFAD